jgi:hypothetical protein
LLFGSGWPRHSEGGDEFSDQFRLIFYIHAFTRADLGNSPTSYAATALLGHRFWVRRGHRYTGARALKIIVVLHWQLNVFLLMSFGIVFEFEAVP